MTELAGGGEKNNGIAVYTRMIARARKREIANNAKKIGFITTANGEARRPRIPDAELNTNVKASRVQRQRIWVGEQQRHAGRRSGGYHMQAQQSDCPPRNTDRGARCQNANQLFNTGEFLTLLNQ